MDGSDVDPGVSLAARFPGVEFRHFAVKRSIPELRGDGIHAAKGDVVALTESWMEPCGGWVEALREAHREHAGVPVVGGPVAFPCSGASATRLEWADYFSEYGEHVPGREGGAELSTAMRISGANCSYKRWALEECRDLIEQGAWEPRIHERLRQRGHELKRAAGALVCYQRPTKLGALLRQRFQHGRGHAVEQRHGRSVLERIARGAAAPLVPWVLSARLWRGLPGSGGLRRRFLAAAGWILALNAAWALGEAAGSWFGPGKGDPGVI